MALCIHSKVHAIVFLLYYILPFVFFLRHSFYVSFAGLIKKEHLNYSCNIGHNLLQSSLVSGEHFHELAKRGPLVKCSFCRIWL